MRSLRKLVVIPIAGALFLASALPTFAASGNDFVCMVFNENSAVGEHNPNASPLPSGEYTMAPAGAHHLNVPDTATNADGTGTAGGAHASPGDSNYTAIWNGD